MTRIKSAKAETETTYRAPTLPPIPEPPCPDPKGWKWRMQDRELVAGDILRCKIGNDRHPRKGQFAYMVCDGFGNGCKTDGLGTGIFGRQMYFDLAQTLAHRFDPEPKEPDCGDANCESRKAGQEHVHIKVFSEKPEDTWRWESFWGIEYLVNPPAAAPTGA